MIHVPLLISNPLLFSEPRQTNAFYSHVDMIATMADLAGVTPIGIGKSLLPVILNPGASVQDSVLFAFDDNFVLPSDTPASHIRALLFDRWTYAVYYSADGGLLEYELYDNVADPGQLTNLLHEPEPSINPLWMQLHRKLTEKMAESGAAPSGFVWPEKPLTGSGLIRQLQPLTCLEHLRFVCELRSS